MPEFTAERVDRSFTDEYGVEIHYHVWAPGRPKAIVQLAHGLGEHAGRYEWLAQTLVRAGYGVVANDHRGHGRTGVQQWSGDLSMLGRLGPGGLPAAVAVVRDLTSRIREEFPGVPVVLLGHSWGSLMAQKLLNDSADAYAAAVLTGTAYRTPLSMNGGNLNRPFEHPGSTGYEWLSRDPAVVQTFVADPLTFYADVLKLFGVVDGLRLYGRPRRLSKDLPLLIMIGERDSLGGEASVRRLATAYARRGRLTDVEVVVYPEARHEIFNELNRDEVASDLVAWLDARI